MNNPPDNRNPIIVSAALNGFLAVALGAFGAHGLKTMVTAERLGTWETAVHFHLFHVFALLVVGMLYRDAPSRRLAASAVLFKLGMILFSGSLYVLVILDQSWLGMITPFGGVALLAGWALLAWDQFTLKGNHHG